MGRVEVHLPDDLVARIKQQALSESLTLSAWATQVFLAALQAHCPAVPEELPSDPQVALLEMVARYYNLSVAAKHAKVPLMQALDWIANVPGFEEQVGTCQEMALEEIESDMLAIGRGERGGNWGALVAVLNAHHPQYGIKGELMSRILGDVIEQFYGIVAKAVGEDLGDSIKSQLREAAEKKLIQFKR